MKWIKNYLTYFLPVVVSLMAFESYSREYFNPAFLEINGSDQGGTTDLSVFETKNSQPEGTYRVDISVNNEMVTPYPRDVVFTRNSAGSLIPCITVDELKHWGVRTTEFPNLKPDSKGCADLNAIPDAFSDFRFNQQHINLSIPQAAMNPRSRDAVPTELWDEGIPAMLLNYSMNNHHSRSQYGYVYKSTYLNLRPGLNLGAWRLRNYTTWQRSEPGIEKWNTVYSYVQRNIIALQSQLTLGDSSAPADVFDSVPFRGIQLKSDDDMLPYSIRNYAPVVRGVARSDALVVIRQNGYVVYETSVAPGAFEISDLASTGGAGDLNVTIKEADGSVQQMIIPFASLPVLQREGRLRYSVTGGQFRSYAAGTEKKPFVQGTTIYGLPLGITTYSGLQNAGSLFQSYALGVGKNIGSWGAFSFDLTHSISIPKNNSRQQGQSFRVRYSKNFLDIGTNFSIAGYRYSTSGYRSLEETLGTYRRDTHLPLYINERRRNRAELLMNQDLWQNGGTLNLSLVNEDYWKSNRRSQSANLGYYNNFFADVGIGLNYSWNRNDGWGDYRTTDKVISLNVNVPIETLFGRTYATYSASHTVGMGTNNNIGLSGSALEDYSLSWGMNAGHSDYGERNIGGNASWKTRYGTLNGSYNHSRDNRQFSYGMSGGVMVHENGITLSQQLGETVGLVKASGAADVSISNYPGLATDSRGYAVVPYLTAYRRNDIRLDGNTIQEDTDIRYMSKKVVPTRGAVVRAEYLTSIGYRVLMTLSQPSGKPVPFGAVVSLLTSNDTGVQNTSIVGDRGEVFMSGLPEKGTVQVQWSNGQETVCRADYVTRKAEAGLWTATAVCKP